MPSEILSKIVEQVVAPGQARPLDQNTCDEARRSTRDAVSLGQTCRKLRAQVERHLAETIVLTEERHGVCSSLARRAKRDRKFAARVRRLGVTWDSIRFVMQSRYSDPQVAPGEARGLTRFISSCKRLEELYVDSPGSVLITGIFPTRSFANLTTFTLFQMGEGRPFCGDVVVSLLLDMPRLKHLSLMGLGQAVDYEPTVSVPSPAISLETVTIGPSGYVHPRLLAWLTESAAGTVGLTVLESLPLIHSTHAPGQPWWMPWKADLSWVLPLFEPVTLRYLGNAESATPFELSDDDCYADVGLVAQGLCSVNIVSSVQIRSSVQATYGFAWARKLPRMLWIQTPCIDIFGADTSADETEHVNLEAAVDWTPSKCCGHRHVCFDPTGSEAVSISSEYRFDVPARDDRLIHVKLALALRGFPSQGCIDRQAPTRLMLGGV